MYPFIKTVGSLTKANLIGLMLACAGLAVIIVLVAIGGITWLTADIVNIKTGWLDTLVNWIVAAVTGIGGWFMLPALTVLIAGMFQEQTIYRVEHAYYPDKARNEPPRFWPDMLHDIRFTLWAVFLNIMILPLYLVGIGFFLSIALNSYLLGREFFESVAGHHLGKPEARKLGRNCRSVVYGGGFVITMLTLVPLVNLFVPVIAIVWMVHVYHRLNS
jgi:CysZ protein